MNRNFTLPDVRLWLPVIAVLILTCAATQPIFAAEEATDATHQTLVLEPTDDSYIDAQFRSENFGQKESLLVADGGFVGRNVLARFDIAAIPDGSIIQKATLRFYQSDYAGDGNINIDRIAVAWNESTVTWLTLNSTAGQTIGYYAGLSAPSVVDQYVEWNITSLVSDWHYRPALIPNFGLQLRFAVAGAVISRTYNSREAAQNPPQLVIEYTPPPSEIVIPYDPASATVDGTCDPSEYKDGLNFEYLDAGGQVSKLYLKQDDTAMFVCVEGVLGSATSRFFGLYLDRDQGAEKYAESEDYSLRIDIGSGRTSAFVGTGIPTGVYQAAPITGWAAVRQVLGNGPESGEFRVPLAMVTESTRCSQPFALAVYHHEVPDNGSQFGWPQRQSFVSPETWMKTRLERPNCPILVCSGVPTDCNGRPNATVYEIPSGRAFAVDANGFVEKRSEIVDGSQLWAVLPVSRTADASFFHTSGAPRKVEPTAFTSPNPGVMTLLVGPENPLQLQNLSVSSAWYVEGDPAQLEFLNAQITEASNYLYDFTDGQFALGRVTIRQSFDGWDDAHLRIHLNNTFQPRAIIGGIVTTETVDPSPVVTITYNAGQINMGSYWNRFGVPPGQPVIVNGQVVDPVTYEDDWAMALSHELGHYMLFLFDTYIDVNGQQFDSCTGSAMGNTYDPLNHAFIFNQQHWDSACKQTLAYERLQGRHEWNTIQTWYQWIQPPTVVVSGTRLPVNLTTIQYVPPSTPPGTSVLSNTIALGYQDNEKTSAEARAFILRNGRVLEQGKPAKNSTSITLLDPQVDDRLCIYDINDNAEGNDTPRHQFGCEVLKLNDATLTMTKDESWEPLVSLTQVGLNELRLVVSQTVPSETVVKARLYPEYEPAAAEIELTHGAGILSGTFSLLTPVPPAHLQLFVDEPTPGEQTRREVIFDRGTGGGGAFGPARFYSGVLIVSSDGDASYDPGKQFGLETGESITWQSMPGTPPLPTGQEVVGQSYRLDAFPSNLVEDGEVKLQYEQPSNGQTTVAVYFWNGTNWELLPTIISTPIPGFHADGLAPSEAEDNVKVATAPSQGVGVYAVLAAQQNSVFLPLVQR